MESLRHHAVYTKTVGLKFLSVYLSYFKSYVSISRRSVNNLCLSTGAKYKFLQNCKSPVGLFMDNRKTQSFADHSWLNKIGLPLRGHPILLITRMITDRIGLHSVLLPLLIIIIIIIINTRAIIGRLSYYGSWSLLLSLLLALLLSSFRGCPSNLSYKKLGGSVSGRLGYFVDERCVSFLFPNNFFPKIT